MELLDIAEVAERSGVAPSALRFYERRGLLDSAGRNGLRRTYQPEALARLALISCARSGGFTIAEIAALLNAKPDDSDLRAKMAVKVVELNERIAQLGRMRASLEHAAVCTHQRLVDCPEFKMTIARQE
ncbi:MerR family transcriptional regulator [Psychromicrobium lacuslunae]|uniref:MerR family transcriptional regulator n=1 Tax=Psychromicrobium lacuslunae TaxID=1618207 RepID=A0A0D4BYZ9_9MICC|nr:MerR family transcriptional regulator [Psychromicrobium lacuslunae]AJT41341.1 MerR family transcriptional regulator [Psychromicrobium lacuslunae]